MKILKTVLIALIRKQPVMVVTFDEMYGFPSAKCSRVSREQFTDASLFLNGKSLSYGRKKNTGKTTKKRKKENSVHKFFRILFAKEVKEPERIIEFPLRSSKA